MISSSKPVATSPRTVPGGRRTGCRPRGDGRRHHEQAEPGAGDDGVPGHLGVVADDVEHALSPSAAAPPSRLQERRRAPARTAAGRGAVLAEAVEPVREVPVGDPPRGCARAPPPDEPGQRDDEGRQAEASRTAPLQQPPRRHQRHDHGDHHRRVVLVGVARTAADQAITDATERSISPLMMTKVIDTTTITFSMCSWNRLTKLSTLR